MARVVKFLSDSLAIMAIGFLGRGVMNFKESKVGYMGGFGRRKGKEK